MNEKQTQEQRPQDSEKRQIEDFKNQVIGFLTRLSQVAEGAIGKLRVLMAVNLLCAAWLVFFGMIAFKLSWLGVMPAVLGFLFPALLVWKLHRILNDVACLPGHLPDFADGIRAAYRDLKDGVENRLTDLKGDGSEKRFKNLFRMGSKLVGLKTLLSGLKATLGDVGHSRVIESVIIVAGPGFALLMTLSIICTVLLVMLTLISVGAFFVLM